MKKYKTWEVIKALAENPKLRFKCNRYTIGANSYGSIVHEKNGECSDMGEFLSLSAGVTSQTGWELIQESVDFLTAVKAYSEGKTIRCEANGSEYIFNGKCHRSKIGQGAWFRSERDTILSTEMILNGTWYVEEGNE